MDTNGASGWQVILAIGGVLLLIGMILGGQIIFAGVILVFLLILGAGALLYRVKGPPES